MKREQLKEMGLEKERIDSIMKINDEDIEHAKEIVWAEAENLQTEVAGLKTQVKDRDTQLETLQASTGDAAAMKEQIATLQTENSAVKQAHESEMTQLKIDFAVEKTLTGAKAKNVKAVKALLELDDVKFDKEGNVKGLQEQIDKLTTDDGTKFLFEAAEAKREFKGFQPGVSSEVKPGTNVDITKMSYEELCAFVEQNPNAAV